MLAWKQTVLVVTALGVVALFAAPAGAQRTGDHIVPSIETVCDGDPFNFGLCNAYCEALDCEAPDPLGTPRACRNLLRNYKKHSGGALPPCACPCQFDLAGDFAALSAAFEEEQGVSFADGLFDPPECNGFGPGGLSPGLSFLVEENVEPGNEPHFLQIFYWLTAETCNAVGGIMDSDPFALAPDAGDFDYNIVLDPPPIPITAGELAACESVLTFLCTESE